jgi:hypothetical protein
MVKLTYITVTVLLNSWVIGFLGYGVGGGIHLLLLIGVLIVIYRIVKEGRLLTKKLK